MCVRVQAFLAAAARSHTTARLISSPRIPFFQAASVKLGLKAALADLDWNAAVAATGKMERPGWRTTEWLGPGDFDPAFCNFNVLTMCLKSVL